MSLQIQPFFHADTSTWTYLLADKATNQACIIDCVLDFDLPSGQYHYQSADALIAIIREQQLQLVWICETHAHADHLSAADYIKSKIGGQTVIGQDITQVQQHFSQVFSMEMATDASQFDQLVSDGDSLTFGEQTIEVIATPGHTPDSVSYKVGDNIFIGDTFFHPTIGTARCDFPGGDSQQLFASLQTLLNQADDCTIWLCHDYPGADREAVASVTVAQQKQNIHLVAAQNQSDDYCQIRDSRDAQLAVPKLLYPALQVNICAGKLPASNPSGANYLKIPLSEKK